MTTLFSLSRAVRGGRSVCFRASSRISTSFITPVQSFSSEITRQRRPFLHCLDQLSTFTRPKQRLSLLAASSLQEGDLVHITLNGDKAKGIIKEVRGSGWYAVQVRSSSSGNDDSSVIKVRGKQLSQVATPEATNATELSLNDASNNVEPPVTVPPPTIIDIDAALQSMQSDPVENKRDLEFLQQCAHHASVKKWVMFTDLHCAPSTLDTCLQVLQKVHSEALQRNAGVLFLGDFWHHRATIRIDVLNAVLREFQTWQVPMIMIPGHHDQVTLGGHNHGLVPLEHAYRVNNVDGTLVFSHPTKFMKALFVPHIRNVTIMESVLSSKQAKESSALLVHADVTGAYMNDLIVSQGGVPPSCFPPNKPIYSGHFHKPHAVKRGDICIDYVGSPYETSLSEAQQKKSLVVLDASEDRKCIEKIPLDIGRKHFRATSLKELLKLSDASMENMTVSSTDNVVKSGDRVVVTLAKDDLEEMRRLAAPGNVSAVDAHIRTLRHAGAVVEVREIPSEAGGPLVQPQETVEEMTPQSTLVAFLTEEVRREALKNNTAEGLLQAGLLLLDELEESEELNGALDPNGNMTNLELESVTLQGFGSFKEQVTYPLQARGLVLVRGRNKDEGGDSNGSGKSSLAMATLWALTGTLDPRPMQDAKVADVVNNDSKSPRVSVRGLLNGKPFVITRTKTSTKGALVFQLDGRDLTTQSIKDTQAIIDENIGVGPQINHGQFAMNGLLEATDVKLKEELSLVVPLSLWQQGVTLARAKSREASKKLSEFEGMIRVRSSDVEELMKPRHEAEAKSLAKQTAFERVEAQLNEEIGEYCDIEGITGGNYIQVTCDIKMDDGLEPRRIVHGKARNKTLCFALVSWSRAQRWAVYRCRLDCSPCLGF